MAPSQTTRNDTSRQSLSLWDACAISIGIIIGPGIFETAPSVAQAVSGLSEMLILWVIGAVLSYCGVLCYSELAARYPENGGEYVWLQAAYGDRLANLYLWAEVAILKPGIIAAMAFPSARYIQAIVPQIPLSPSALASLLVLCLTAVNLIGFQAGKTSQNLLSAAKVLGLALIIALGLLASLRAETPEASLNELGQQGDYGLALILVLFTFGGWSDIANVTADIRTGARGLLKSASLSLALITALYVLINIAFVNLMGLNGFSSAEIPIATGLRQILPSSAASLVYLLIAISCLGAIQGTMFTGSRLYGRIPAIPASYTRERTDRIAFLCQGALSILVIILTQSFISAVVYTTTVVWVFFLLKGFAIPILRAKFPESPALRVPYYPLPLIIFASSCVFLIWSALRYDLTGSVIAGVVVLAGIFLPTISRIIRSKCSTGTHDSTR
jgi:APA family basic amino acid/polyamine antiporter